MPGGVRLPDQRTPARTSFFTSHRPRESVTTRTKSHGANQESRDATMPATPHGRPPRTLKLSMSQRTDTLMWLLKVSSWCIIYNSYNMFFETVSVGGGGCRASGQEDAATLVDIHFSPLTPAASDRVALPLLLFVLQWEVFPLKVLVGRKQAVYKLAYFITRSDNNHTHLQNINQIHG
ncbi:hypothetical protein E2C01_027882 [Portunus trituberculatus]|uniref:Uncharacterized protein n=1 Tax=Portunus trituberculatus TaxID=210409 RepID=A0A5B7EJ27_PORTR|nr:hypothetical protein [Portunus trituberculatus]